MSTSSVSQPAAAAADPNPVAAPETSQAVEEAVQGVAPQPEVAESYKTLQLLKGWPVVLYIFNKGQEAYKSVKHSTRITETGLNISEKVATNITAKSSNIIQKLKPVWKFADYTVSEVLERVQKSFPVMKESPEKVYDTVVGRVVKFISPAVNTAVTITEVGRQQVKRTTRTVIKSSRNMIMRVENRLERLENYVAGTKIETAAEPPAPPAASSTDASAVSGPAASKWSGKLVTATRSTLHFAASASLFGVGAAFWVLERLPVVRGYVAEAPAAAAAAPPASPSHSSKPSSGSSYYSLPDEPAANPAQAGQLPPQLSQATQ